MDSLELRLNPNEDPDVNLVCIDDLARIRRWLSTQARLSGVALDGPNGSATATAARESPAAIRPSPSV